MTLKYLFIKLRIKPNKLFDLRILKIANKL